MWLLIIFSFFIGFSLWIYYTCYYKPRKILNWYKDTLEGLGYKVHNYGVLPMSSSFFAGMAEDQKVHGDPNYSLKHSLPGNDIALYNVLNKIVIDFINPDLLKIFFAPDNFPNYIKEELLVANTRRVLGYGIAFSEGGEWKRKRKIINTVFNFNFLMSIIPKIVEICNKNIQTMQETSGNKQKKGVYNYNILELWNYVFANVMMECFFGSQSSNQKIDGKPISLFMIQLMIDVSHQSFQFFSMLLGTKFLNLGIREKDRSINKRIKVIRQMAKMLINKRLADIESKGASSDYKDIIEALVYNKSFQKEKQKSKTFEEYDYNELIQEFCTFYTGGTDTTAHLLTMMIYYILQHPDVEKRLREEINEIIHDDSDIKYENLKELKYIDWIQNQTTRMYGPGNGLFPRKTIKDHQIYNIPIVKGTVVNVQPMGNHYNDKYYKDPHTFRPERWEKECDDIPTYAFMGFSAGQRGCIGKHLALLESKIALIKFIKRYDKIQLPKQNFKMRAKFLYDPEPMQLHLERNQS